VLSLVAAACASSASGEDEGVKIAFIQDLSAPDAEEHVQPALQAAQLAVAMYAREDLSVTLVEFDLAEDPAAVDGIVSDPSFVAAIVGPGGDGSAVAEAGIPTVSVSTAGPTPTQGIWRRFVAPMEVLADSLAAEVDDEPACMLSEGPAPDELAGLLAERIEGSSVELDPDEAAAFVSSNGCASVVWAGSPDPGAELARALQTGAGIVGGDRLLDPDFAAAGLFTDGARAVCACADLSATIEPEAMRFIQDYQAEFGSAPGPYAWEAWDATRALLAVLSGGWMREGAAARLEDLEAVEGLGSRYRFGPTGELVDPGHGVTESELRFGRWVSASI
jgi:branched-chain amino acid transport system substrate-binding protein